MLKSKLSRSLAALSAIPVLFANANDASGYADPTENGGKMLTIIPVTYPQGLGEPLNIIISATSDVDVLIDREEQGGLRNYFLSVGFSGECLGQHLGSDQAADLGDGNGVKNETAVMRWNYGNPFTGTCTETVQGGNHFRYWVQNGPRNNTGAIFMALSYELPASAGHDIIRNGYVLGRDWLLGNATAQSSIIASTSLVAPISSGATNSSNSSELGFLPTFSGNTSSGGYTYSTTSKYVTGLLTNSSDGINHYLTVEQNGRPANDGLVAILEIKITQKPGDGNSSGSDSSPGSNSASRLYTLTASITPLLIFTYLSVACFTYTS